MIRLQLDLPRSTTRKQWKEADRYRRIVERLVRQQLKEHEEEIDAAIIGMQIYGTGHFDASNK